MVFAFKNPSPEYFISKLKEIEHIFRGQYLSHCMGKNKDGKNGNFEKGSLENMTLPSTDLLNFCSTKLKETHYNLRSLQRDDNFCTKVYELVDTVISSIEFVHLKSFKEQEILDNNDNKNEVSVEITEKKYNCESEENKVAQNCHSDYEEELQGKDQDEEDHNGDDLKEFYSRPILSLKGGEFKIKKYGQNTNQNVDDNRPVQGILVLIVFHIF